MSRGFTSGRGNICIWVEEPNGCWPLVLNTDRDAVQLAEMLLDAVLYPPT